MFDQARGVLKQRVYTLAAAVTGTGAQAAQSVKPQTGLITSLITITGGASRTVQVEISFDGVTYFPVGTSRTATGSFVESIPAAPKVRVNVSANSGSTVDAKIYA